MIYTTDNKTEALELLNKGKITYVYGWSGVYDIHNIFNSCNMFYGIKNKKFILQDLNSDFSEVSYFTPDIKEATTWLINNVSKKDILLSKKEVNLILNDTFDKNGIYSSYVYDFIPELKLKIADCMEDGLYSLKMSREIKGNLFSIYVNKNNNKLKLDIANSPKASDTSLNAKMNMFEVRDVESYEKYYYQYYKYNPVNLDKITI